MREMQVDLFGRAPIEIALETRIARGSDPQTSKNAGEEVTTSGRPEGQLLAVLVLVRRHPGRTSMELAKLSNKFDRYVIASRLPELEKAGLVCKGPPRMSSAGQRPAHTWKPV
jgi:single-stranded DNA-specific DHH superfamily exonuclease